MLLEFYVEELSAEAALINLVPRILDGIDFEFDIHSYNGKHALLKKLPDRLRTYRHWPDVEWCAIVLVDRDDSDCNELKQQLENISEEAGLKTLTKSKNQKQFQVMNRIAIEELEAWFFGDNEAMRKAYPRVPEHLNKKAGFRDPDAIKGGTWERLEEVLKSYHPGGLEKIRAAEEISRHMQPECNTSRSFQVFRDSLMAIFE
jgi:hypothetical protein